MALGDDPNKVMALFDSEYSLILDVALLCNRIVWHLPLGKTRTQAAYEKLNHFERKLIGVVLLLHLDWLLLWPLHLRGLTITWTRRLCLAIQPVNFAVLASYQFLWFPFKPVWGVPFGVIWCRVWGNDQNRWFLCWLLPWCLAGCIISILK